MLAGVHIVAGVGGAVLILLLAILVATGFGTLGLLIALRTGSGEGVQSMFPLLFFLLLISSMNLPRNLIEVNWFRDLATINPVSYMIEAMRSLVISGGTRRRSCSASASRSRSSACRCCSRRASSS